MSRQHVEVRSGAYADSVTLLAASKQVAAVEGVAAAQAAMATPLNLDVLQRMGFDVPAVSPDDLVVAVRLADGLDDAAQDAALAAALDVLAQALGRRSDGPGAGVAEPPRTTGAALRRRPAPLVVVSTPGAHAATEALDALQHGACVLVFSDDVPLEAEVALKREAAGRGLLVMGPDCGTAVVAGVGLGFANVVRPGPVSLVAASGTGAQQLMALLDAGGVGVRHCLGLGGRDLSAAVGGLGALQSLRALAADEATELVVLVSKPADPSVAAAVRTRATDLGLRLEEALLGPGAPDLTAVAERVLTRLGREVPRWPTWGSPSGAPERGTGLVRGLFGGGTLCDEAMAVATPALGPVASNIPLDGAPRLDADGPSSLTASLRAAGHAMVDLGDDALTRGRPHPMIDASLRLEALDEAARDARVRVVLLDVVLGHGAHPHPAAELAPAIERARRDAGRPLDVVVSLTGTAGDPQGRDAQAEALAAAGAAVCLSNAAATRAAVALATGADA